MQKSAFSVNTSPTFGYDPEKRNNFNFKLIQKALPILSTRLSL
jgi:hypothetical protein